MCSEVKLYLELQKYFEYKPKDISDEHFENDKKGDKLYIYYDLDTVIKIINKTNTLWFKDIASYLDVEEHKEFKKKFINIFKNLKNKYTEDFINIFRNVFDKMNLNDFSGKFFILCTSYESDNCLCWETFTKKYKNDDEVSYGACICFNKSSLDIIVDDIFEKTHSLCKGFVCYDESDHVNRFIKCLDIIYRLWNNTKNEALTEYWIRKLIITDSLLYKNSSYNSEKEFRYIIDIEMLKRFNNNVNICNNGKYNYLELKLIKDYDKDEHNTINQGSIKDVVEYVMVCSYHDKNKFKEVNIKLSRISYNIDGVKDGESYL